MHITKNNKLCQVSKNSLNKNYYLETVDISPLNWIGNIRWMPPHDKLKIGPFGKFKKVILISHH
jgi:hypothetical protein